MMAPKCVYVSLIKPAQLQPALLKLQWLIPDVSLVGYSEFGSFLGNKWFIHEFYTLFTMKNYFDWLELVIVIKHEKQDLLVCRHLLSSTQIFLYVLIKV